MKKFVLILGIASSMFLISCSNAESNQATDESDVQETNEEAHEIATSEEQLRVHGDLIVDALDKADFDQLATFVHPEKGIRFSPYVFIEEEEQLVFEAEQVRAFSNDDEVYDWGTEDGTGDTIQLTPNAYYNDYIYIRDFIESNEVLVNDIEARGNMLMNVEEVYPEASFVSYYVPGTDVELDWANLILAFEEVNGDWYLVGIIVDRWTT
ncbi:hypothetical protein [Oceanobacillus polygoni]|uniref:Uncharacterized protein n=1 Tax=Oceanobacillus polygoni TaxID=1235259 RepID=A0A9X0YQE9_9BACI|nr:hypothetical protein [Oceanobacillus polygoni]MBP2077010.1 hypothetical protein [Oceanobacillus polygoni]